MLRIGLTAVFLGLLLFASCTPSTAPAAVTSGGKLRILTEEYPPFNFIDKNMNITGQSTDMVRTVLQLIGQDASIELMLLSDALKLAEQPNTAIYSINRIPDREQKYKWAGPIGSYEQAFYAKKGTTITLTKLEDARSAGLIGVYKDDAGNQFLIAQGFTNLNESLTDIEALKKLMNGEVQLWLGNKNGFEVTAAEANVNPDDIVLLPNVTIRADLYIAFSKDMSNDSVSAWQKAIDSLKNDKDSDGKTVYDKLRAKYSDPYYVQSLMK